MTAALAAIAADPTDLVWAAGVIDACGSIHLGARSDGRAVIWLRVPIRHAATGERLTAQFGGGSWRRGRTAESRPTLAWEGRRQVPRVLSAVRPWLSSLDREADRVLDRYPWPVPPSPPSPCHWPDCPASARARHTCSRHYQRLLRVLPPEDRKRWDELLDALRRHRAGLPEPSGVRWDVQALALQARLIRADRWEEGSP